VALGTPNPDASPRHRRNGRKRRATGAKHTMPPFAMFRQDMHTQGRLPAGDLVGSTRACAALWHALPEAEREVRTRGRCGRRADVRVRRRTSTAQPRHAQQPQQQRRRRRKQARPNEVDSDGRYRDKDRQTDTQADHKYIVCS
jgi:hypothetical protein